MSAASGNPIKALQFDLERAIRYHRRFQRHYEARHALATGLAVVFGTATFASLLSKAAPFVSTIFAGVVTVMTVTDLVLGFAKKGWLHGNFATRYTMILRDLVGMESPAENDFRKLRSEIHTIEAEEPPINKVVNAMCHNEVVTAFFGPDGGNEHRIRLMWYQRLLAPTFSIGGADFFGSKNRNRPI